MKKFVAIAPLIASRIANTAFTKGLGLALSFLLVIAPNHATAKSQLQQDKEDFNNAFLAAADTAGPSLIKCGQLHLVQEMKGQVKFLEAAYRRLNKNFPQADPPIENQITTRNEIVCDIIRCSEKPQDDSCSRNVDKAGRPYDMLTFDYRVQEVKKRLLKAKIDPEQISTANNSRLADTPSCPRRAQYYQDAYRLAGRVDDLVCLTGC